MGQSDTGGGPFAPGFGHNVPHATFGAIQQARANTGKAPKAGSLSNIASPHLAASAIRCCLLTLVPPVVPTVDCFWTNPAPCRSAGAWRIFRGLDPVAAAPSPMWASTDRGLWNDGATINETRLDHLGQVMSRATNHRASRLAARRLPWFSGRGKRAPGTARGRDVRDQSHQRRGALRRGELFTAKGNGRGGRGQALTCQGTVREIRRIPSTPPELPNPNQCDNTRAMRQ